MYVSTSGVYNIHMPTSSAWGSIYSTTAAPLNAWSHVVLTRAASGATKMYVNGTVVIDAANHPYQANTGLQPAIGANMDNPTAYEWFGNLAHLSIYHQVLTPAEIIEHYHLGTNESCNTAAPTLAPTTSPTPIPGQCGCYRSAVLSEGPILYYPLG